MNCSFRYIVGRSNDVRKNIRNELSLKNERLTTNIFQDIFGNITVLKSFVENSNPNEDKYLNLNPDIYKKIKDKPITIIFLEREYNKSIFHKKYKVKIQSLTPTQSLRNNKYGFSRFIIDESTIEQNIISEIYEGFKKVS